MPTPTFEQIQEGQKANDQVWAYASLKRRGVLYYYGAITLVLSGAAVYILTQGYWIIAALLLGMAVFWTVSCGYHWWLITATNRRNLELLQRLKAEFDDQLPWIQQERHFAKLQELVDAE